MTHNKARLSKRWLILPLAIVVAAGLSYAVKKKEPAQPPFNPWGGPVAVRTVTATEANLALEIKAIGTVVPANTALIRSRVEGTLLRLAFTEGDEVKEGQLLAEIDPAPYQVRLNQAQGQYQQQLAQLDNAEKDLALYQGLIKKNTISQQQLDQQQALVRQLQGALKVTQAQIDDARLQFSYTQITAPFSGRTGIRRVDIGNLISANDPSGIVTLTQTHPIAVQFSVAENRVQAVREAFNQGNALSVEAWDRSERQLLAAGTLTTIDNQIDASTGTLRLKATFNNETDALFPNQFVNVRLQLGEVTNAIIVPSDAVQFGNQGNYVYRIDDGKAFIRTVKTGANNAGKLVIEEGLEVGDVIVLEGLDRLRDGRAVNIVSAE